MVEDSGEHLDEEHISKALGQFQLALNGLLHPLRVYGQDVYVDSVIQEILKLAWQLHLKLEGFDIPYEVTDLHW